MTKRKTAERIVEILPERKVDFLAVRGGKPGFLVAVRQGNESIADALRHCQEQPQLV